MEKLKRLRFSSFPQSCSCMENDVTKNSCNYFHCTCTSDITAGKCDYNSCCDPDCSADQVSYVFIAH